MALVRRCARLLWMRTRFIKLNEKQKCRIINEINPTNRTHYLLRVQTRTNSQYESNNPTSQVASNPKTNVSQLPERLLKLEENSGMCYADLKNVIDKKFRDLTAHSQQSTINSLQLIESCRDMLPDADLEARRELVNRVWNMLEKMEQNFTVKHYNVMLSIYAQNMEYLNAEEFIKSMKVSPDKDTYRLLMAAVAEIGDYSQALLIMAKAKDMGYAINEAMFNSLILAYSISYNPDGAQAVLNTMKAAKIEPSSATYCALSRGFAASGDLRNLERTLSTGGLNAKQLMSVVKSSSTSGHGKHIHSIMKYLPSRTDDKSIDIICTVVELTHLGKAQDAFEIINCLPVPERAKDSTDCFADFFLYELVKSETPMDQILEICNSLISSEKNPSALLRVTEGALRLGKEDIALSAFQALQNRNVEIRPHFYWPLLLNAVSSKGEADVIRLVKHMIDTKVDLDYETLFNYIIPCLSARDPLMVVRQLQDCGIRVSQLLTPLMATLLSQGNLKGAIALTEKLRGKIDKEIVVKHLLHGFMVTKNVEATARLLSKMNSNSDQNGKFLQDVVANERVTVTNEELGSLVVAFDKQNLRISKSSAESLEPRIARIKNPKGLSDTLKRLINPEIDGASYVWIPHPRDMTVEELENHLADLRTKGMNTRGVLRRLIQAHCGKNNLKKAEEFAEIFTNNGFEWTTGMISGMFSLYAAHNMLEKAEIRYKELREKHRGFKIDDHKIIDYATVLVNNNKFEKALEVLGEQENIKSRPETSRNCWRLLNAVVAAGQSENVERTLNLMVKNGYCEISNNILGPLIRTHLANGDLPAAVKQFKDCALTYQKLPLKQELIRALIKNCNDEIEAQKQLTEILTLIKNIHGDAAANSQLIMALAATNKHKELHTFINMHAVNQATLNNSIQKLIDEKDLSALQTILKACRGVRKLDNTLIYDSILTLCSRSGDHETAIEMWERMQSDDVTPSQQFVEKLKNLLISQRVPLPPELLLIKGRRKR